jgi:hybrid polyketide synthase/nonribosomal peptide synthetase ACE1
MCDHPQYFEAHGTGTPTGDPIEAEAISSVFALGRSDEDIPLYVGSIKTVVGHTEGTAGLAGILKASLALQHAIIPPNLLFENLNPSVTPFYRRLCIPTVASRWPSVPNGMPRRASVNR